MSKYAKLSARIGYEFRDQKLFEMALTHSSYSKINNERLEFLGDIILSFIISDALYNLPQSFNEGELSDCRAYLVKGAMLKELADELSINEYILMGVSNKNHHLLHLQNSIYANAIEAIIGAIYLDSNIDICRKVVLNWYGERIHSICPKYTKDPKTILQEYAQSRAYKLPKYSVVKIEGDKHNQTFRVTCNIPELKKSSKGSGGSKKKAEQDAADKLLQIINNES